MLNYDQYDQFTELFVFDGGKALVAGTLKKNFFCGIPNYIWLFISARELEDFASKVENFHNSVQSLLIKMHPTPLLRSEAPL